MAPYLDGDAIEPVEDAIDVPLKSKPQLVAPEPGMRAVLAPLYYQTST